MGKGYPYNGETLPIQWGNITHLSFSTIPDITQLQRFDFSYCNIYYKLYYKEKEEGKGTLKFNLKNENFPGQKIYSSSFPKIQKEEEKIIEEEELTTDNFPLPTDEQEADQKQQEENGESKNKDSANVDSVTHTANQEDKESIKFNQAREILNKARYKGNLVEFDSKNISKLIKETIEYKNKKKDDTPIREIFENQVAWFSYREFDEKYKPASILYNNIKENKAKPNELIELEQKQKELEKQKLFTKFECIFNALGIKGINKQLKCSNFSFTLLNDFITYLKKDFDKVYETFEKAYQNTLDVPPARQMFLIQNGLSKVDRADYKKVLKERFENKKQTFKRYREVIKENITKDELISFIKQSNQKIDNNLDELVKLVF